MSLQRSVRFREEDYNYLVEMATTQGTTVSTLVRQAIELLKSQESVEKELKGYSTILYILEGNIKANQKRLKQLEEATK